MRKTGLSLLAAVVVMIQPLAAETEQSEVPSAAGVAPDCSRRVTCGDLNSCAQACGFYQQCKLETLDRDDDGIPCETICERTCDARS